jgi:hypothetical protein
VSFTFADLQAYCRRNGWLGTLSDDTVQLGQWINDWRQFLALARKWPFLETLGYFNLLPVYATGTATLTALSGTVTGAATAWDEDMIGQEFWTSDDSKRLYTITDVTVSPQVLTIDPPYIGPGGSGLTYSIRYVKYPLPSNYGQDGVILLDTGMQMNVVACSLAEWRRMRMFHRGTMGIPYQVNRIGTAFYVHGAPSDYRQVSYSYWRRPAVLTDSDADEFPDYMHGLLAESLAVRLKAYDADAALLALRERWYQDKIDEVFGALGPQGPIMVDEGGMGTQKLNIFGGLDQILRITD